MYHCLVALSLVAIASAQQVWNQILVPDVPVPYVIERQGHEMVPHLNATGFFMFGGFLNADLTGVVSKATEYDPNLWHFNTTSSSWSLWSYMSNSQLVPNSRAHFVWMVNQNEGIALMHGGDDYAFVYSDTWFLDLYTGEWSFVQDENAPPPLIQTFSCSTVINDTDYREMHDYDTYLTYSAALQQSIDEQTAAPQLPTELVTAVNYTWPVSLNLSSVPYAVVQDVNNVYQVELRFGAIYLEVNKTCQKANFSSPTTPALTKHQGVFDHLSDAYYLFGGVKPSGDYSNETYKIIIHKSGSTRTLQNQKLAISGSCIRSSAMIAVQFSAVNYSTLVSFGGFLDRTCSHQNRLITSSIFYLPLNGTSSWSLSLQPPYEFSDATVKARWGARAVYSPQWNQMMIVGGNSGTGALKETLFLTFANQDPLSWYWRTGAQTQYATYQSGIVVVPKRGDNNFQNTNVYRFGGQFTALVSSGIVEAVSFEPRSSLQGSDSRPPPPPVAPVATDGSYIVSLQSLVVSSTVVVSSVRIPVTTTVGSSTSSSTTSGDTSSGNSGLSGSLASLVYGGLGLVGALIIVAVVIGFMQKRSRTRRGVVRPNKNSFYAL